MPIRLDPSADALIAELRAAKNVPVDQLPAVEGRLTTTMRRGSLRPPTPPLGAVEDHVVATEEARIPVRIYRPLGAAAAVPLLVYFHGGGWVIGDIDSHDAVCRILAASSGMAVASVNYRKAPEFRFPAAPVDAIDATRWLHRQSERLGFDAGRIALAGDSAGGNLATVVALAMHDEGPVPIAAQALIYPAVDMGMTYPSHEDIDTSVYLTHAMMRWFRDTYIARDTDVDDWRASPLRAASLAGLPPAYVLITRADPLYDECVAFAERLAAEGVAVRRRDFDGQFHGFITMGARIPEALTALEEIAAWLREVV